MIKLDLKQEAIKVLINSITKEPLLWCSWMELINLLPKYDKILKMDLPKHWISYFFMARILVRDMKFEAALNLYELIQKSGFHDCTYIKHELANIYYLMKDMDGSLKLFKSLLKSDPYSLEYVDVFSNVLYVLEKEDELSDLAHRCHDIDPFRPETCCVIGNYYSLKGEREKAITYFQRALTLNPDFYSAWILIGHEHNEMKNTEAALFAYHKALKINPNDYRIWNGFGLTFELVKMPHHTLYYYKKAHALNPSDSRIIMAVGQTFETIGELENAKAFYSKALVNDDSEDNATFKLAKVCEKVDIPIAVLSYTKYLQDSQKRKGINSEQESHALLYLGHYYFCNGDFDKSLYYFQKCMCYVETNEEAKDMVNKAQEKLCNK